MKRLRLGKLNDLTNIVIASIGFFIFYTFMRVTNWIPIQNWGLWGGGKFIDTRQVLRWSDCYNSVGMQIFESTMTWWRKVLIDNVPPIDACKSDITALIANE